jgi:hypothetical protein
MVIAPFRAEWLEVQNNALFRNAKHRGILRKVEERVNRSFFKISRAHIAFAIIGSTEPDSSSSESQSIKGKRLPFRRDAMAEVQELSFKRLV